MASTRSKLDEIVESVSAVDDPRFHINRRPSLPSILVIAVLAVLAGAAGPTAIARWAKLKEDLLREILDLPNGIPGKVVFRRVLVMHKPEAFEAAFNVWIARLRDGQSPRRAPIARSSPSTARRPAAAMTRRRTSARCTSSPPGPAREAEGHA
jgi:DDE_Tnp_1-associated